MKPAKVWLKADLARHLLTPDGHRFAGRAFSFSDLHGLLSLDELNAMHADAHGGRGHHPDGSLDQEPRAARGACPVCSKIVDIVVGADEEASFRDIASRHRERCREIQESRVAATRQYLERREAEGRPLDLWNA